MRPVASRECRYVTLLALNPSMVTRCRTDEPSGQGEVANLEAEAWGPKPVPTPLTVLRRSTA